MPERWAGVVGHPDYEVSDMGNVRNVRTGYIQQARPWRSTGRAVVSLTLGAREFRARVVLRAFVGEPGPEDQASHLNGDRTDDRLANLTWEDARANNARKRDHGTLRRGEAINTAKLTEGDVREIRDLRAREHLTTVELGRRYGVSSTAIGMILKGQTWRHVA